MRLNHFDIKAREMERTFTRRVAKGVAYKTGTGRNNMIVEVTPTHLVIKAESSQKPTRIPRKNFRNAIAYLFFARTTTRKELERFFHYNSALLGLLRLVFADIAKIARTLRGLLRLSLNGTRFFFSGLESNPKDQRLIHQNGGLMVLMSYFYLRDYKSDCWKDTVKSLDMKVLLDSGEYSRYNRELKGKPYVPLDVVAYGDFIEEHQDVLFNWVNLDVIGDPKTSQENAAYLAGRGLPPMEVWHAQSSWEELERLVRRDLPVIAVGGSAMLNNNARREIFDELFRRYGTQNFHLLGGGPPIATEYPWFSTDANTWRIGRSARKIVSAKGQRKAPVDWSVDEALIYNIRGLATLEENYTFSHQLELFPQKVG